MRALAVVAVILGHGLPARFAGGNIGVDVFFTLSGFLITGLLVEEHRKHGNIDVRAFFARRFLRLAPALVVCTTVVTPIAVLWRYPYPWVDAAAALTWTSNLWFATGRHPSLIGHTWSLAVEEQFYLVWPSTLGMLLLLARGSARRLLSALLVLLVGTTAVAALWFFADTDVATAYLLPTTRLPQLVVGSVAWVVFVGRRSWPLPVRWAFGRWPLSAGLLATAAWATTLPTLYARPLLYPFGLLAISAGAAIVVVHLSSKNDSPLGRALSIAPLRWIGQRSYGIYLWHYVALVGASQVTGGPFRMPLAICGTFALAAASWRYIEAPSLRRRREPRAQLVFSSFTPIRAPQERPAGPVHATPVNFLQSP